jgi:hypothetical protein
MSQSFTSFKLSYIREKTVLDVIVVDTTEIVNELTVLIISLEKKEGQIDD